MPFNFLSYSTGIFKSNGLFLQKLEGSPFVHLMNSLIFRFAIWCQLQIDIYYTESEQPDHSVQAVTKCPKMSKRLETVVHLDYSYSKATALVHALFKNQFVFIQLNSQEFPSDSDSFLAEVTLFLPHPIDTECY